MTTKYLFSAVLLCAASLCANAATIKDAGGWLESAYVEWNIDDASAAYNVYVSEATADRWTRLDNELVRSYGSYGRADALGLSAGNYRMKVVPVSGGKENSEAAIVTEPLTVKPHDRSGFAHKGRDNSGLLEGVGAYKNDGTLKDEAIVLYITAQNSKTLTVTWPYTTDKTKTYTGFQTILDGYRKCRNMGGMTRPLCVRIIGTISKGNLDNSLTPQGLAVKGEADYSELPLTIEGVGNDATFYKFGMQVSQCQGVEIRNLGILLAIDDCVELNKHNSHIWVHNMDLFYGQTGSEADKVKGDGAIDIKYSSDCTVAYNHFWDCGKCCLIDPSASYGTDMPADRLTYHHNWFDHSDQRLPRCRHGKAFHVYNNYYDGNGLYGVGLASNACAFVESNWFRNCKYPVINSTSGTDRKLIDSKASKKGLLSGEASGACKFFDNHVEGATSFITQHNATTAHSIDAYEVTTREETIGEGYSNFDTDAAVMYQYSPTPLAEVPDLVTGQYGAGRCQKGDFSWTFDNSVEDTNCELIAPLKSALEQYTPALKSYTFSGATAINRPTTNGSTNATTIKRLDNNKVIIETHGNRYNLLGQK